MRKQTTILASRGLIATAWFGLRNAWRCSPVLTISSLVLLAVASVFPGLQVLLIARLVDLLSEGSPAELSPSLIGVAVTIGVAEPLAQVIRGIGYQLVSRARAAQHSDLAHAVAAMPPSMLRRAEIADRVQSVKNAIPMQTGYVYLNVLLALQGLAGAIGVCVAVFTFNIVSGILVLLAAIPVYLASSYLNHLQDRMDDPLSRMSRRATYLESLITHQRTASELNSLGVGQRVATWVSEQYQKVARYEGELLRPLLRTQMLAGLVTGVLVAAALLVLVTQESNAGAAAGVVAAITGAGAIRSAGFAVGSLAEASPRVFRFKQLLSKGPEPIAQPDPPAVGTIEAENLTFSYDNGSTLALDGVSFAARKGEMIALVGPNGAGKTTAVNCLLGVVESSSGRVLIDGKDALEMEESRRLSTFGALSQEFGRFELTVRDAIGLGQPQRELSDKEVADALRASYVQDVVEGMPHGVDTQLGDQWQDGVGVSGGQWQRLALARIHARDAPIWILDEPTSAIDAEAEHDVFNRLHETRADRITIVVSHRAWTLRAMDHIYVLDQGRVVESGTFDELVSAGGRFALLFRSQMASSAE